MELKKEGKPVQSVNKMPQPIAGSCHLTTTRQNRDLQPPVALTELRQHCCRRSLSHGHMIQTSVDISKDAPVPAVRGPKADSVWGEGLIGHSENKCAPQSTVVQDPHPSIGETDAGRSPKAQGQPGLQRKTLSQKQNKQRKKPQELSFRILPAV